MGCLERKGQMALHLSIKAKIVFLEIGLPCGFQWITSWHGLWRHIQVPIIINNNNTRTIFIVLSSWPQAIARVHSVHLMNCRTTHKWPSTLRPSHLTWAVSPPIGSYRLQFIIITQPEKLILIYHPTWGRRLSWAIVTYVYVFKSTLLTGFI